ncbi:carbamate kinase [Brevibacillus sp. SYSU BS000544]|uniref:carbamate kinase n=1 Tax=Brevibacillus sp. SYSU BS000544 TaxID=3416443 RepID=UPI003CE525BA
MKNRIVIALGGNAIFNQDLTAAGQQKVLIETVKKIVPLIREGNQVIITHGNGSQVGNLLLQQKAGESEQTPALPLDTCVSMTQGSIGYWLQNAFINELRKNSINKSVVSLITQVKVRKGDYAFHHPTKPIGPFLSREEAIAEKKRTNSVYIEDAGKGWRKVVPSPDPVEIVEEEIIRKMVEEDVLVITCGGGGVPVIEENGQYAGVEAVIEKDLISSKLARVINADYLVILTTVSNVYIHFNTPHQKKIERIDSKSLNTLKEEGHFAKGTMLPKIEAALQFLENNPQGKAIITSVDNVANIFSSKPGTLVTTTIQSSNQDIFMKT